MTNPASSSQTNSINVEWSYFSPMKISVYTMFVTSTIRMSVLHSVYYSWPRPIRFVVLYNVCIQSNQSNQNECIAQCLLFLVSSNQGRRIIQCSSFNPNNCSISALSSTIFYQEVTKYNDIMVGMTNAMQWCFLSRGKVNPFYTQIQAYET